MRGFLPGESIPLNPTFVARAERMMTYLTHVGRDDLHEAMDRCLLIRRGKTNLLSYIGCNKSYCDLPLLCPWCCRRHQVRAAKSLRPRIQKLISEGLIFAQLTLTVAAGGLDETLPHLISSVKRLNTRRTEAQRGRRGHSEYARISAARLALDFSIGEEGWTPHIHALVGTELENIYAPADGLIFDQRRLQAEWLEITGDSKVVQSDTLSESRRFLAAKQSKVDRRVNRAEREIQSVLAYPFRWKTDFTKADRLELHAALKGIEMRTNRTRTWGRFR